MREIKKIPIGSIGVLELTLPVIEFSGPAPGSRVVIIAGQHGNEVTPLFVIRQLVERLTQQPLKSGVLTIVSVANPLGLLLGTREEPLDREDLNRQAPGDPTKTLGKRIAAKLTDACKGADLVIDLHAFNRQCAFTGVLIRTGDAVEKRARTVLRAIQPDCVWLIDAMRQQDQRFAGSLDIVLGVAGVPAVTLEMERHATLSDAGIIRVTDALEQVLAMFGMLDVPTSIVGSTSDIPMYVGNYLYFDTSGLFIPEQRVLGPVRNGQRLGTVTDLRTFEESKVSSPLDGTLLTVRFRDIVRTGAKLGSIGSLVGKL